MRDTWGVNDAVLIPAATRAEYADQIRGYEARAREAWDVVVARIIETGRTLIAAQDQLAHGEWTGLVEQDLGWNMNKAQRFMAIARHPVLSNPATLPLLPPSREALYELTKVPPVVLQWAVNHKILSPEMTVADADYFMEHAVIRLAPEGTKTRELKSLLRQAGYLKQGRMTIDPEHLTSATEEELRSEAARFLKHLQEQMRKRVEERRQRYVKSIRVTFATWGAFEDFAKLLRLHSLSAIPVREIASLCYPIGDVRPRPRRGVKAKPVTRRGRGRRTRPRSG